MSGLSVKQALVRMQRANALRLSLGSGSDGAFCLTHLSEIPDIVYEIPDIVSEISDRFGLAGCGGYLERFRITAGAVRRSAPTLARSRPTKAST